MERTIKMADRMRRAGELDLRGAIELCFIILFLLLMKATTKARSDHPICSPDRPVLWRAVPAQSAALRVETDSRSPSLHPRRIRRDINTGPAPLPAWTPRRRLDALAHRHPGGCP